MSTTSQKRMTPHHFFQDSTPLDWARILQRKYSVELFLYLKVHSARRRCLCEGQNDDFAQCIEPPQAVNGAGQISTRSMGIRPTRMSLGITRYRSTRKNIHSMLSSFQDRDSSECRSFRLSRKPTLVQFPARPLFPLHGRLSGVYPKFDCSKSYPKVLEARVVCCDCTEHYSQDSGRIRRSDHA